MNTFRILAALLLLVPATLDAQRPTPEVAASGRASTAVSFNGRLIGNLWYPPSTIHSGPAWMRIDYGQPHARGREIYGGLVPWGEVWRLGANLATHLTLDLHAEIGGVRLPAGTYTLYLIPHPDRGELVVSRETQQWGTEYDASLDVARIPLDVRTLPETKESLAIELEPTFPQPEGELPEGTLRIQWGDREYSTGCSIPWP